MVTTEKRVLLMIEPNRRLYGRQFFLAVTGVYPPFRILVAKFGDTPFNLGSNHVLAISDEHLTTLFESDVSHSEIVGIINAP